MNAGEPDRPPSNTAAPAAAAERPLEPPWTQRVSVRLTLFVAVVTFFTLAALTAMRLGVQERLFVDEAIQGAALFGDTIRSSTHDQMLSGNKDEAYKVMERIGRLEGVDRVRIFNKEGKITFSTESSETGTLVDKKAEACLGCHAEGVTIERPALDARSRIYRVGDHRVVGMITPIYNDASCAGAGCHAPVAAQRVLGVVDVSVSLAKMDAAMARLRWSTLLLSTVVTIALTALLAWVTRKTILRPVRRLVRATRRIAAGNLEEPIEQRTSDELGLLAGSFDDMRRALLATRGELDGLMADLERQVEERTLALRGAQAQLVQREKLASLGKLSASIAHEINNPLAGILTFSKLLVRTMEEGPLGESGRLESAQRLRLIQRETERCTAIVRNLLDFARQRPPDLREVDVRAALDESLALVDHQVQMQGIEIETHLDGHPVARADFGQLRQAFVNVMLNACDAMGKGGRLTVRCGEERGEVVVSVADTGSGISEEDLPRIFDPFFSTKEKGTGLGLSVVYGIVQGLGGRLDIDSRPGDGTIVIFRFPAAAAPAPAAAAAPGHRA